jgi:hypothetical protein
MVSSSVAVKVRPSFHRGCTTLYKDGFELPSPRQIRMFTCGTRTTTDHWKFCQDMDEVASMTSPGIQVALLCLLVQVVRRLLDLETLDSDFLTEL